MPFDLQPILRGKLLGLRPLQPEDFHDLYVVASDPLIWEQHPSKDRYQEEVFKEFFRDAMESGGALIALDSKDNQVIWSSRFYGYDKEKSEIEIGWTFLARSHWGGIYNREMKQLMLRHAFQFVNSVIFLVGPQNLRSQRAMEKIGGPQTAFEEIWNDDQAAEGSWGISGAAGDETPKHQRLSDGGLRSLLSLKLQDELPTTTVYGPFTTIT